MNKRFSLIFAIILVVLGLNFVFSATTPIVGGEYLFINMTIENGIQTSDSVVLRITTDSETTCWYTDLKGASPSNSFEGNYGTKHEVLLSGLDEGTYKYYVACGNQNNLKLQINFAIQIPVYGEIELSEEPPLKEGQYEITLTTSKECSEIPTLEYTLDGITKKEVSLEGSGTSWKGYLIVPGNVGETVGYFEFEAHDVYGTHGKKLIGDELFIVDTVKPDAIAIINAFGYEAQIRLNWFYEEEFNEFNIYRSENPQIEYTDFYKTTTKKSYTDNDVERGKTYYYKVSGVDDAGNIADLSKEVYATALITNSSVVETGLDLKLVGRVENVVSEINSLIEDIQEIKSSIKEKQGKEKELFEDLRLSSEIDSVVSELNSLKRDVENYKTQDLSETELDNKLDSANLKINIIKKKTPENLILIEENSLNREINEENIQRARLEYLGELGENNKKEIDFVFDLAEERNLKITSSFYNLEIVYMDGSRKEITVVEDELNSQIDQIENFFYVISIPKDIVEKASELEIININYEVVKEDPVLLFYSDTKKIIYYIEKEISAGSLENILLSPIKVLKGEEKTSFITGNAISNVFSKFTSNGSWGIAILILFGLGLLIYLVKIRKKDEVKPTIKALEDVKKMNEYLKQNKEQEAKELYTQIKKEYQKLSKKEKKLVVEELKEINDNRLKWK